MAKSKPSLSVVFSNVLVEER